MRAYVQYIPTKSKFGETVKSAAAKKIIPKERVIPNMNSNPWTFFLLYITAMSIVGINCMKREKEKEGKTFENIVCQPSFLL